jgi:hypothetical protein
MTKIYGMIGYTILYNSLIFPNTEILIISDMHNEPIKNCSPYKQINIEHLLNKYIDNGYKILLEEIPNKKELIPLFPDSEHVNNTRKFYLKNFDKIIGFDIRLDLIDITALENSSVPIITNFIGLFEFFMVKSKLFELPIIKKYYLKMLLKFHKFINHYKDQLKYTYAKINKIIFEKLVKNLNDLLSDIIEFYCFCRLFAELKENKINKFVINCGLYHSENLINIIKKYLHYSIKKQEGINTIEETDYNNTGLCIDIFEF